MALRHVIKPSKLYIVLIFCIPFSLFVGEWLEPLLCLRRWPKLPARLSENDEVRLLLVADPHVQFYHSYWYYLQYFSIMDSDRYLRRYFNRILAHTVPSLIVFLGDLFDRGSMASPEEWLHAFDRFERIFLHPSASVAWFVVPGDNDVGGEWNDVLTADKMNRFRARFSSYPGSKRIGFVQLFVDPLNTNWISPNVDSELISVYVSHIPMVTPYGSNFSPSLLRSQPSLLINGHDHVGYVLRWNKSGSIPEQIDWVIPPHAEQQLRSTAFQLQLNSSLRNHPTGQEGQLIQFGVPSCSYRSGHVHSTAYGLARLYRNRTVLYQLFHLPNRFNILLFYGFMIAILVTLQLIRCDRRSFGLCSCICLIWCIPLVCTLLIYPV